MLINIVHSGSRYVGNHQMRKLPVGLYTADAIIIAKSRHSERVVFGRQKPFSAHIKDSRSMFFTLQRLNGIRYQQQLPVR